MVGGGDRYGRNVCGEEGRGRGGNRCRECVVSVSECCEVRFSAIEVEPVEDTPKVNQRRAETKNFSERVI